MKYRIKAEKRDHFISIDHPIFEGTPEELHSYLLKLQSEHPNKCSFAAEEVKQTIVKRILLKIKNFLQTRTK